MLRILFLLFTTLCVNGYSAEFASCHNCSNSYSFSSAAEKAAIKKGRTKSLVYSYNYNSTQIKAYDVYVETEPNGIKYATAIEKSVDSTTKSNFVAASNKYREMASEVHKNQVIPSSVAISAYQVVGASYIKNDVIDYVNDNATLINRIQGYIAAVEKFSDTFDIEWKLTTFYSNGSIVVFKLKGLGLGKSLDLELYSAKDIDNNDIPLTKEDAMIGEYRFTMGGQQAANEFTALARSLGVPITSANFGGGGSGGGGTYKMSCTSDGSRCEMTYTPN